jgi:hypothetical protein
MSKGTRCRTTLDGERVKVTRYVVPDPVVEIATATRIEVVVLVGLIHQYYQPIYPTTWKDVASERFMHTNGSDHEPQSPHGMVLTEEEAEQRRVVGLPCIRADLTFDGGYGELGQGRYHVYFNLVGYDRVGSVRQVILCCDDCTGRNTNAMVMPLLVDEPFAHHRTALGHVRTPSRDGGGGTAWISRPPTTTGELFWLMASLYDPCRFRVKGIVSKSITEELEYMIDVELEDALMVNWCEIFIPLREPSPRAMEAVKDKNTTWTATVWCASDCLV